MTIYKVITYNIWGNPTGERLFTSYRTAHAFEKTCNKENEDPTRQDAMILYKYKEHKKDGWLEEIYIGPSNW